MNAKIDVELAKCASLLDAARIEVPPGLGSASEKFEFLKSRNAEIARLKIMAFEACLDRTFRPLIYPMYQSSDDAKRGELRRLCGTYPSLLISLESHCAAVAKGALGDNSDDCVREALISSSISDQRPDFRDWIQSVSCISDSLTSTPDALIKLFREVSDISSRSPGVFGESTAQIFSDLAASVQE